MGNSSLPVPLPELNPQLREAIRLFTDPLLPTFGNKMASCIAAGYASDAPLHSETARTEIARIEDARAKQGRKVAQYLGHYAFDAARELVNQLRIGAELTVMDPSELLREPTDADIEEAMDVLQRVHDKAGEDSVAVSLRAVMEVLQKDRLDRADVMTKHNRVTIQAAKERRQALELILKYHLGDGRTRGSDQVPAPTDLSQWSDDELVALGEVLEEVRKERGAVPKDDTPVVEGDFSVED